MWGGMFLVYFSILKFPIIHSCYFFNEMINHEMLFNALCFKLLCLWPYPHLSPRDIKLFLMVESSWAPGERIHGTADLGFLLGNKRGLHGYRAPFNVSSSIGFLPSDRDSADAASVCSGDKCAPFPVSHWAMTNMVQLSNWGCRKSKHFESQQHLQTFQVDSTLHNFFPCSHVLEKNDFTWTCTLKPHMWFFF